MSKKNLTVLIDTTTLGAFVDVPADAGEARDHALRHNAEVRIMRALEGEAIAAQAVKLNVKVHVGMHGVLLRGPEDRIASIVVPESVIARDASDRWMPFH